MKLKFDTDEGYGTRATLGVIVLETDETLEQEFRQIMGGSGVALYHSRIPMVAEIQPHTLAEMEKDLPGSAALFPKTAGFDVIGYGCTSASTVIGSAKVAQAIQSARPEAQVTNPLAALIAGCNALKVTKLGFLTPYVPDVSHKMRDRLGEAGLSVSVLGSFEEGDDRIVARISERSIQQGARAIADAQDLDALVISCTNLRCLNIIPQIEAETGLPVLSSNQALAWHMLRLAGIHDSLHTFGRLFKV